MSRQVDGSAAAGGGSSTEEKSSNKKWLFWGLLAILFLDVLGSGLLMTPVIPG
jgi:hypothetical protein